MAIKDEQKPLHILFFPFLAPGHLIPIADMAALFAARGVKCTILTTPVNAQVIRSAVDRANDASRCTEGALAIDIAVVPFPDVGLPPASRPVRLLREPFNRFLAEDRPDAVVADSFFDWATDAAAEHGVPRMEFLGGSLFSRTCIDCMLRYNPVEATPDALVLLPGLPHRVELRRSQMINPKKRPEDWPLLQRMNAADQRSYGEVFNSFHDLEPDYLEKARRAVAGRLVDELMARRRSVNV
ncbi:unnamed protein product [Miscanthus lutarioriparius]|uniref:Uncharacterized protein n=1 Tax=Miscanthus lutarioriparius TaxID=422564 RepID=A0A811PEE2_9POAL|nr:unnamed protein product [Miscanthus lutarioriparius]